MPHHSLTSVSSKSHHARLRPGVCAKSWVLVVTKRVWNFGHVAKGQIVYVEST